MAAFDITTSETRHDSAHSPEPKKRGTRGVVSPPDMLVPMADVLDEVPLDRPADELEQPPSKRPPWRRIIGAGLIVLGLTVGAFFMLHTADNRGKQTALDASLTGPSSHLQSQITSLPTLSKELETTTQALSTLTINGQLSVNGSLVLGTAKPSNPTSGQLYYDQTTNQLGYYNGNGFVYLQGGGNVTNNTTNITNNFTTNKAGNTFNTYNNTTTVSGGGLSASGGTSGTLAMFGSDTNTLTSSFINQSGTTLNIGTGAVATNLQAGLNGVNVVTEAASGISGDIHIATGNSSTTAAGNIDIDTGSGVISGEVVGDKTFEDGADNMRFWFGDTVAQSSAQAHSGTDSLAVTMTGQFWGVSEDILGNGTPVIAGHQYFFSAWVRAGTVSRTVTGSICWDAITCTGVGVPLSTVTDSSTGWTEMTATVVAPGGATRALWVFGGSTGGSGDIHYFDDLEATDLSSSSSVSALDLGATNAQLVTIGNMNEIGPTTIDGGSGIVLNSGAGPISATGGAITISGTAASSLTTTAGSLTLSAGGGTGGGVLVRAHSDSTTAFQVQGASGTSLLTVDSTDNNVSLGTGAGSTIGYTGIGSSNGGGSGLDSMTAQRIVATAGGTITSVSAYIGAWGFQAAPNNKYQFALYADDGTGTKPGAYIASSSIGTLGSSPAWYTLPITATLSPSTTYWLAYWQNDNAGDSNNGYSYKPAAGQLNVTVDSVAWQSGASNGWPTTFPTPALSGAVLASMYASYSASGPALTINSSGTLTQSGAALFQDPADSAQALQIENSLGASLLTADTADMEIVIGGALSINGDLTLNGHIVTGGSTPTIAAGAAACTSPTVSIAGTDTTGTITVNTGTGCTGGGTLATITFANAFSAAPTVVLTPGSPISQTLGAYVDDSTISATSFDLGTNATPLSSQTFKWNYWIAQ